MESLVTLAMLLLSVFIFNKKVRSSLNRDIDVAYKRNRIYLLDEFEFDEEEEEENPDYDPDAPETQKRFQSAIIMAKKRNT